MPEKQLPDLLNKLRWIIPILMAGLGMGYILIEHFLIMPGYFTLVHTLRQSLIIGTLGPTLTWSLLTWATKIARSRQQAVRALERRALQLETAGLLGQKVTAILEVDELLAEVVRLIREKFGFYHVQLFLVDGQSQEIVLRECCGRASEALKIQGLRLKIGEQGITGWVAQTGQPALHNDIAREARYYPHELLPETRSELAVPLKIGDVVVGVLDVQSEQCEAFEIDDLAALQILADQVAIAIENANLFRETRRQFETMRVLHDISLEITSHLEDSQVLKAILRQATGLLNAQGSALCLYDPAQNVLHSIAIHNMPPDFQGVTLRVGEGIAGQVIALKEALIVNDYHNWAQRSPHFQDSPFDAGIGVPLRWQDQVVGALVVLDRGDRRHFTKHDIDLLNLFADLASIALKNAELYAHVIRFNQQLEGKVERRTNELVVAREEIARKAEQLQRLLAATVSIQEEERTRIARDLHDGSNQLITGTLYEIQAAQQSVLSQREEVALEKLEAAKKLLRTIDAENRRIISGLRPPILDAQGLAPALKWHAHTYQEHSGLICSIKVTGQPIRLSSEIEIASYRIVQESLNNVVAHAQARCVKIEVDFSSDRLSIVVEDDGIGFDIEDVLRVAPGHMGLIGIRERAQTIGGQINVQSEIGCGTQVVLQVPLPPEAAVQSIKSINGMADEKADRDYSRDNVSHNLKETIALGLVDKGSGDDSERYS